MVNDLYVFMSVAIFLSFLLLKVKNATPPSPLPFFLLCNIGETSEGPRFARASSCDRDT